MINEQLEYSKTSENRVSYIFAELEKDREKRPFVEFLGGNIIAKDPFIRSIDSDGTESVEVDTSPIASELNGHAGKYKGSSKQLFAHYVLSLAEGESLGKKELLDCAKHYMQAMGYGNGAKWVASVHNDTDNQHIHIIACRAQLLHGDVAPNGKPRPPQFSIVSDSNGYKKGWEACRELEAKHNLKVVENPDQCFGRNGDLFRKGNDQAKILRGIFGDLWKQDKPQTFSELVLKLGERGVRTQIKTEPNNPFHIKGIMFKLNRKDGRWISGSKLKATRFTFDQLILKEGINYNPSRDNTMLGLPPTAYTLVQNAKSAMPSYQEAGSMTAFRRVYVKLLPNSARIRSYVKNRGRLFGLYADSGSSYLGFNASFHLRLRKKSKSEVEIEIEAERIAKIMKMMLAIIRRAIDDFFDGLEIEFEEMAPSNELPDTALRLNVPVMLDLPEGDLEDVMELDVEDELQKQMKYLAILCKGLDEPDLKLEA
jgi:hypothetical protein